MLGWYDGKVNQAATAATVPEPPVFWLLGSSLLAFLGFRKIKEAFVANGVLLIQPGLNQ